jgi:cysteine desulfurase family protein (TIGR01976 family)
MTTSALLDVAALRDEFPALAEGAAHFDGPGGSQVPRVVADVVGSTLRSAISNRGRSTASERRADDIVISARAAMADLLGVDPGGVVFGRSMTQLTYDFSRTLAKGWREGDEVVVSRLDHDANVRPWVQAAGAVGATVRWVDFDVETAELTPDHVRAVLSDRTRLVALTGASNLIGTRPPLDEIAGLVKDAGALFYVDGVHLTPHALIDVDAIGADFFVCSPYKFCGPHCGVLAARPELLDRLEPDKLLPSANDVPERFEFGTLPYELLAGTAAAVDFLAGIAPGEGVRRDRLATSIAAYAEHEDRLRGQIERGLAQLPGARIYSRAAQRTPTVLFTLAGHASRDVYLQLAAQRVNAPAGSFYAIEPSRRLGLGAEGGVRVGLAPYNDSSDVERLLTGLAQLTNAS